MRPYSLDLRQRVAAALDAREGSQPEIARRFQVSVSFITRLIRRRRQTGSLAPKPHGGGHPPALDRDGQDRLRQAVRDQPDATLAELAGRVGVPCGCMAIFRALRKLKITRKKKSLHAAQRDSPRVRRRRRAFRRAMAAVAPEHQVFVDETGANTAMTRTYGRAPRGRRVKGAVPGRWTSVTLIAGLRLTGVVAPFAFEGAMDAPTFRAYVEQILRPVLRSGDVVIWDNLKPHADRQARAAVTGAGASLEPLPPYSPDLAPIEELWSKVKGVLRSVAGRTTAAVYEGMRRAFASVCPRDIRGWFSMCGSCATQS
jgi:transposase